MGLYTFNNNDYSGGYYNDGPACNRDELLEMFLVDDISRLNSDQIQEFCAPGGIGEALCEANRISKRTIVRLSKQDDLDRRVMLTCLQMAKENKDTLFTKLAQNRVKEKELLAAIRKKYSSRAEKEAKITQKEYIKSLRKRKVPDSFVKAGGTDRI